MQTYIAIANRGAHLHIFGLVQPRKRNYQAIHLYGQARLMSTDELATVLAYLMDKYEQALPAPAPTVKFPKSYAKVI